MADMFSWFKKYDVHLCPAVQGTITENGKPLAGIRVFRELDYDKSHTDDAVTDENGHFYFAEKNIKSRLPGNKFDQSKSRQVISLDYQGKLFLLWYLNTSSIKPQQAVVQRLASLNCDLSNEELEHVFPNIEKPDFPHSTFSICRWPD
ncbi:MAG: carboxypeptidase-like regulatory domain-containing protein [Chromatiaceae bacterium]|nr:carboxypeptidase-like regulatory domain-containing protein [Chromatiaceae bacterium]